jgi:hypothetical protein
MRVSPNKAGKKITYFLEVYASGRWTNIDAGNVKLSPKSTAAVGYGFGDTSVIAKRFRIRAQYERDTQNVGAYGHWSYFTVTS